MARVVPVARAHKADPVSTVQKAHSLLSAKLTAEQQLRDVKRALFSERKPVEPKPPLKVERVYPQPKSALKLPWRKLAAWTVTPLTVIGLIFEGPAGMFGGFVSGLACLPFVALFYDALKFQKVRDADVQRIVLSPEFQAQIHELEQQWDLADSKATEEYEAAQNEYANKLLPEYLQRKQSWEQDHKQKIAAKSQALNDANQALSDFYATTSLIPPIYQNDIHALTFFKDYMTPEYDFKEIVNMYVTHLHNDSMEREAYRAAAAAEQEAEAARKQAFEAEQARKAQEDTLRETQKMRRDQNIANAIALKQRHDANKQLRSLNDR